MNNSTTSRPSLIPAATGLLLEETQPVTEESARGVYREYILSDLVAPCSRERRALEERFWRKVEKTSTCWLWTGACFTGSRGERAYGAFLVCGKAKSAHAVSWALANGTLPDRARLLRHLCNTCEAHQ